MGDVAALIPLIQGGMQAASSYQEGAATKMVTGINAKYANLQASDALRIGEQDAAKRLQQGGMEASAARAKAAASGVNVDTGSVAQTQGDIKQAAIMDASTIRMNAAKQAWGFGVEAANYKSQGRYAMIKGYGDAAQSVIGGGLRVAYDQYKYSRFSNPAAPNLSTVQSDAKDNWNNRSWD